MNEKLLKENKLIHYEFNYIINDIILRHIDNNNIYENLFFYKKNKEILIYKFNYLVTNKEILNLLNNISNFIKDFLKDQVFINYTIRQIYKENNNYDKILIIRLNYLYPIEYSYLKKHKL